MENILKLNIKNGFDYKDKRAEPKFLIQDFLPLPKNAITMLSAGGGTGKSFLSLQVAIKVILEDMNRRVLIWSSEDDITYIIDRFYKIAKNILNLNDEKIEQILKQIDFIDAEELPPHINLLNDNDFNNLIKTFAKYRLVIIDPLIAFYGGEENSNSEARKFMNLLNSAVKKYLFTILLIHHHNKNQDGAKTRGASAFVDAVRLLYSMSVKDEEQLKTNQRLIKIEKDNLGVRTLQKFKNNDEFDLEVLPYVLNLNDYCDYKGKYPELPGEEIENDRI